MISGKIIVTCIGNLHWTMEAVGSLGTWLKPLTCRCQSPIGTSREKRLIRKSATFPVRIWTKDTVTNFECLLSINWEKVSLALWPVMEFLCVTLGVKLCSKQYQSIGILDSFQILLILHQGLLQRIGVRPSVTCLGTLLILMGAHQ